MSEYKIEVLTPDRLKHIPNLRDYLTPVEPLTDAEINATRTGWPPVYGEHRPGRPLVLTPPPLLPPDEVARRERELDVEGRLMRGRTLAMMAGYGREAMTRWFPQGTRAYLDRCFPKSV